MVGVVFLSPLTYPVTVTPAALRAVDALVQAIARDVPDLLGVNADVATAARFAGEWAARCRVPVTTEEPQRLYRLGALVPPRGVPGVRRPAPPMTSTARRVGRRVPRRHRPTTVADNLARMTLDVDDGLVSVWDDGGARSMATLSPASAAPPASGTCSPRVPARGRGYTSRTRRRGVGARARAGRLDVRALHPALQPVLERDLPCPRLRARARDAALPVRLT